MPIAGKQVRWERQWKREKERERVQTLPNWGYFLAVVFFLGGFICQGYDDSSSPVLDTGRYTRSDRYTRPGFLTSSSALPASFFLLLLCAFFVLSLGINWFLIYWDPPPVWFLHPFPHFSIHTIIYNFTLIYSTVFFSIPVL